MSVSLYSCVLLLASLLLSCCSGYVLRAHEIDDFGRNYPRLFQNDIYLNMIGLVSSKCAVVHLFKRQMLERMINIKKIKMFIYTDDTFLSYQITKAPRIFFKSKTFNPNLDTVIFIHGYMNIPTEENAENIAVNFAKKDVKVNFLSFDSSAYIQNDYVTSAGLVPYLGKILANFLVAMVDGGVEPEKISLIGYSLGAQIAGTAARTFFRYRGTKISRITAIEPTSLCFSSFGSEPLTKEDAGYVDVIHTSALSLFNHNVGHADFHVNGNTGEQPGCGHVLFACSHTRGIILYTESIARENIFTANRCDSWESFKNHQCTGTETSVMGYGSPPTSRGSFFFKTRAYPPFGIGAVGLL